MVFAQGEEMETERLNRVERCQIGGLIDLVYFIVNVAAAQLIDVGDVVVDALNEVRVVLPRGCRDTNRTDGNGPSCAVPSCRGSRISKAATCTGSDWNILLKDAEVVGA